MGTFNDDRVQEMLRGRLAVARYPFPGLEGVEIGVRALSDAEIDGARVRATQYVKSQKVDVDLDPGILERAIEREIIWQAMSDPDDAGDDDREPRPFFPSPKNVRSLDALAIAGLWGLYTEQQERISPARTLSKQELKEMVDALGKGPVGGLMRLSPATLRACVRSMALALQENSPTPKSSTSPSASEPAPGADA